MGRPEKDLPPTRNRGLLELASWLRALRAAAGLKYAALADRTEETGRRFTATTLQRAADGRRIPTLRVVEAYAQACGATATEARKYWRAARAFHRPPPKTFPKPRLINDSVELRTALYAVYVKAGALPLREMDRRAQHGRLPRNTLSRMLSGGTMLKRAQLKAFLEVCEVPEREHPDWLEAWDRAWAGYFGLFNGLFARQLRKEAQQDYHARSSFRAHSRFLELDRARQTGRNWYQDAQRRAPRIYRPAIPVVRSQEIASVLDDWNP
ncbi:helix-turn-helix domain-containing protein [Streptomyces sp. NBC_01764]|uniref:helix-turn-helix domain-containing protein n=1 Tax=Streptomyces sp. NBC_01764 TaxID=2975935 RepID=UPI00225BAF41|nr:helix-turn-helix transcriptional regulator [Streptomyces sp. NBC_01764]MCX4411567.1 helix-turn-helix domain-containing protein [Streptomyces sp. NBC_01764]